MQRIGRVDRRLNPEIEAKIIAEHPDHQPLRGKVMYWNFLPPEELNDLLLLYQTVSGKTLRISKASKWMFRTGSSSCEQARRNWKKTIDGTQNVCIPMQDMPSPTKTRFPPLAQP